METIKTIAIPTAQPTNVIVELSNRIVIGNSTIGVKNTPRTDISSIKLYILYFFCSGSRDSAILFSSIFICIIFPPLAKQYAIGDDAFKPSPCLSYHLHKHYINRDLYSIPLYCLQENLKISTLEY